jgi:hypothetical protein
MKTLLENWNRFIKENQQTNNISLSDVEAIFKYFHVSKKKIKR